MPNVSVFFVTDDSPYTKSANQSKPPDGALAIRRQSIPGTPLYILLKFACPFDYFIFFVTFKWLKWCITE